MKPNSLLGIETNSTAFAYKLLDEISKNEWIEIVEVSSAANAKNFLLFQTEKLDHLKILTQKIEEKYGRASKNFVEMTEPQILDLCLIENAHPQILPALISLEQNWISEALVVVECQSICGILSTLQTALRDFDLQICDVRLMRQSGGISQVFLTGDSSKCRTASPILKQKFLAEYRPGQVECLENPSQKLREFFKF